MLIIGAVLSLLATVFALCGPYFVKMVIDNIEKQQAAKTADIMPILLICGLYVLCVLLSEVCTYFRTIVTSKAGQQIIHEIRVDIFSHIQKLSFNYFDSRPRGKILVRVVHYVNNVADFFVQRTYKYRRTVSDSVHYYILYALSRCEAVAYSSVRSADIYYIWCSYAVVSAGHESKPFCEKTPMLPLTSASR